MIGSTNRAGQRGDYGVTILKCLEPVTAIGCGLLALADPTTTAVTGAAGLFAAFRENSKKHGLDSEALISSMRKAALRASDRFDIEPAARDALTEADAVMAEHLVSCLPTREELAALARKHDLAAAAANYVSDRLAANDPRFAEGAPSVAGFDARSFAATVVTDVITAALANNDYRRSLMTYLQIETLQGVARLEDGMAEVLEFVRAHNAGASLKDQALRGAIARFIAFQPDASDADVLSAVETFERDYRALLEQVSHITVNDNHIQSLKVAAEEALEAGDIATARIRYGEAAKAAADKASEPVRNAAALKSAEASAALTMLDLQAADVAWKKAAAMLMPFDEAAGEDIVWEAGDRLLQFGDIFAQTLGLAASERRWRALETEARKRGDVKRVATMQNWLGNVLSVQGERTEGNAGLAMLAEAVEAYLAALTVRTRAATPADWAMTQNNLGNVLKAQGARTKDVAGLALLNRAVEAYCAALTFYTRAAMPVDWAMTQNNLGTVLRIRGERTEGHAGIELLRQAIAAYRAALTVRTQAATPADWAMTQNNLGIALRTLSTGTQGDAKFTLLSEAVEAYRAALTVYTQAATPANWAATQHNLGIALRTQGELVEGIAGHVLLNEAVAAFRAGLAVRTRAAMPADWAATLNSLGGVLEMLGRSTDGDAGLVLLKQAADAILSALTIWTPEHFPRYYHGASNNLARVEAAIAARQG